MNAASKWMGGLVIWKSLEGASGGGGVRLVAREALVARRGRGVP